MDDDPAELAAFLLQYAAECDEAGVEPLPVRELAALLVLVAGARFEPSGDNGPPADRLH